ncbi:MAG: GNAT family protein [Pseudomonadota bacterium]
MSAAAPHGPWARHARTSEGIEYRIRPIRSTDVELERAFFESLSSQSKYLRFLHHMREPSEAFVAQLVNVDYHSTMAFVAIAGEGDQARFVGVARYAADASGRDCEFAIAVSDDWQCRGIGSTLAPLLFEYAAQEGFDSIYGTVLADNPRMIELAEWLGLTIETPAATQTTLRAVRRLR